MAISLKLKANDSPLMFLLTYFVYSFLLIIVCESHGCCYALELKGGTSRHQREWKRNAALYNPHNHNLLLHQYLARFNVNSCVGCESSTSGYRLMVFGLGNVGTLVAQMGTSFGYNKMEEVSAPYFDQVFGATRSQMVIDGVHIIPFRSCEQLEAILPTCTHVLVTIPPIDADKATNSSDTIAIGGKQRRWSYFCDPLLNDPNLSLQNFLPSDTVVGYISSTSVYGNHDGKWVTEESELKCLPGSKGDLYARAEKEWKQAARDNGWNLNIFRCAGLYGNERSAIHTLIKSGERKRLVAGTADERVLASNFPSSRIHEQDVSRAILYAMLLSTRETGKSDIWNLADDDPAPRSVVMAYASKLLEEVRLHTHKTNGAGADASLKKDEGEFSLSVQSQPERDKRRFTDNKRISNRKIKDNILPNGNLIYATYREGLHSVMAKNKQKWSIYI